MPSKKNYRLLARVNFPLYTVASLTERHILVAGGGGSSKTGIPNVVEIYQLIHNGSTCKADLVFHYETGNEAIMNCAVFNAGKYFVLFAGQEGNCQVYKIKHDISYDLDDGKTEKQSNLILKESKRKSSHERSSDENHPVTEVNTNVIHSRLYFTLASLLSFQTDFSNDPFQKLVKFSPVSNVFSTGGVDGHLRIWKYPSFQKIHDIEAHSDDIDDLDICPLGKLIVTVSRDGFAKVWCVKTGSLASVLQHNLPSNCGEKFIFRGCKFGFADGKNLVIFATVNPAIRKKPPLKCYICKWNATQYTLQKIVSTGYEMISVMAVSDNGRFIGLGTQEGSVKICNAFNLQVIYQANHVHKIFVTGLQFIPTCEESRRITGNYKASLVSISVDNHINIHEIPGMDLFGIMPLTSFLLLTLLIVFIVMDFLKL